jgi:glycosyltransferase involved in cell wall biosynthesis
MIEALDRIRAKVPDFHMVVVGDGPNAAEISSAAETRPWISWVGTKKDAEKAAYFRLADIVLNPGAVGLHVLDAFCAGIPMATTVDARHGPEIAYLKNGVNGVVSDGNPISYAADVVSLLEDKARYAAICTAAKIDAGRYTMVNMVDRFHAGILKSLALPAGFGGQL